MQKTHWIVIVCFFLNTISVAQSQVGENKGSHQDVIGDHRTGVEVDNSNRREGKRRIHSPEDHLDYQNRMSQGSGTNNSSGTTQQQAPSTDYDQSFIDALANVFNNPSMYPDDGINTRLGSVISAIDHAAYHYKVGRSVKIFYDVIKEVNRFAITVPPGKSQKIIVYVSKSGDIQITPYEGNEPPLLHGKDSYYYRDEIQMPPLWMQNGRTISEEEYKEIFKRMDEDAKKVIGGERSRQAKIKEEYLRQQEAMRLREEQQRRERQRRAAEEQRKRDKPCTKCPITK